MISLIVIGNGNEFIEVMLKASGNFEVVETVENSVEALMVNHLLIYRHV